MPIFLCLLCEMREINNIDNENISKKKNSILVSSYNYLLFYIFKNKEKFFKLFF